MDRTAFTAWAARLLPLATAACIGCGAGDDHRQVDSSARPAVLSQLANTKGGKLQKLANAPILAAATGDEDDFPELGGDEDAPVSESSKTDSANTGPAIEPDADTTAPDAELTAEVTAEVATDAADQEETTLRLKIRIEAAESADSASSEKPDAQPAPNAERAAEADEPAPRRVVLPWARAKRDSAAMRVVVERADVRVRHGFELAERGAVFTARAEFVAALQLIAEANDVQQQTRLYGDALRAGLAALRESSDFMRSSPQVELDLKRIVSGHKTPLLKFNLAGYSPTQAAQRYYSYAQEQLAAAAGQEMVGSTALYGMGKVAMTPGEDRIAMQLEHTAQAVALYQAALLSAPGNYRAANELAVLLAESGNLPRARDLLVQSVSVSPQAASWQNLAVVHNRLGEKQLADQALARAQEILQSGAAGNGPAVQWVDADTFARLAPPSDSLLPPAKAAPAAVAPAPAAEETNPPAKVAKKGIADWLPWNPLR